MTDEIDRLRTDLKAMMEHALKLDASNDDYQAELVAKDADNEALRKQIAAAWAETHAKDCELAEVKAALEKAEDTIGDQTDLEKDFADCRNELAEAKAVIANLDERLAQYETRAERAEAALEEWEQCACYDAMMEGPRFKGWDRSAMERCRKRMEARRAALHGEER